MSENGFFNENENDFLLTDQESKKAWKAVTTALLYLLLIIVVIVTAAHGIMVVLYSTDYSTGGGLTGAFLNMVRISFPVTVELAAIVAGLGFISSSWRKGQKGVAFGIEITWLIFAAANMITMFRIERNLPLETWQQNWISYGLPLSALIAGSLVYMLKRTDPDHKRADETAAAVEKDKMIKFSAWRDVSLSDEKRAIEKQKAWVDYVRVLKTRGYTDAQIRFMMQGVPQLMLDEDGNGTLDLLEAGDSVPGTARPALASRGGFGQSVTSFIGGILGKREEPAAPLAVEPFPAQSVTNPAPVTITPRPDIQTGGISASGVNSQDGGEPLTDAERARVQEQFRAYQNARSNSNNGSNFPLK